MLSPWVLCWARYGCMQEEKVPMLKPHCSPRACKVTSFLEIAVCNQDEYECLSTCNQTTLACRKKQFQCFSHHAGHAHAFEWQEHIFIDWLTKNYQRIKFNQIRIECLESLSVQVLKGENVSSIIPSDGPAGTLSNPCPFANSLADWLVSRFSYAKGWITGPHGAVLDVGRPRLTNRRGGGKCESSVTTRRWAVCTLLLLLFKYIRHKTCSSSDIGLESVMDSQAARRDSREWCSDMKNFVVVPMDSTFYCLADR